MALPALAAAGNVIRAAVQFVVNNPGRSLSAASTALQGISAAVDLVQSQGARGMEIANLPQTTAEVNSLGSAIENVNAQMGRMGAPVGEPISLISNEAAQAALRHQEALARGGEEANQLHDSLSRAVDQTQRLTNEQERGVELTERNQEEHSHVTHSIEEGTYQQEQLNRAIEVGAAKAEDLWGQITRGAMMLGTALGGAQLVKTADQLANSRGRLANAQSVFGDTRAISDLERQIMQSAQRGQVGYFDAAGAVSKLGLNAKDAFGSLDEVIAFQELLNKQFAIAGAETQAAQAAVIQLTQAMGSGVLRGEELNSVFEQAPIIVQNIAKYMKIPIGKIREMAAEGKISAAIVKNAMFAAADDINRQFAQMPATWGRIMESFKNYALSAFSPALERISQLFNSSQFEQTFRTATNLLAGVAVAAVEVVEALTQGFAWVVDNWAKLSPYIGAAALALGSYYVAQVGVNAALAIFTSLNAIRTAGGLAAAFSAMISPVHMVAAGIFILVGAIYAGVAWFNNLWGTAISGTGAVVASLYWLGAVVYNVFNTFRNIGLECLQAIVNAGLSCCQGLAANFGTTIQAIAGAFTQLANHILAVLSRIAGAVDQVTGSNLKGAVSNMAKGIGQIPSGVSNLLGQVGAAQPIDLSGYKGQSQNLGEAFDEGYRAGVELENLFNFAANDPMSAGSVPDMQIPGLSPVLDKIDKSAGKTAGNTAAMKDKMKFMDEDLKYMRVLAEREAINRFTTASIKVSQRNTNHLQSGADLDGILDAWANDFATKLEISGEGVHF